MAALPIRWLPVAAIAVALLAALYIGCGGNGGGPKGSPTPAGSATPTAGATAQPSVEPLADTYDLSVETPQFTLYGAEADALLGSSQSVIAGDFNDDGKQDLLVGAPMADGPGAKRKDTGKAFVIFGDEFKGTLDLAENTQDMLIIGATDGDNLGRSVLAADLNDDGVDDIIVGAPGVTAGRDPRTDQGRAYVFFGSSDLKGTLDLAKEDPPQYDFVVTGAEGFSRVGEALASGDVNGDGVDDLILGAPFAGREVGAPPGSPRKEAGEVYAVFGAKSLSGEINIAYDKPDFMVSAEQRYAQFGAAVATGDVNGDGVDDIIAGAYQMDTGDRADAGAAYVFFGGGSLGGRRFITKGDADVTVVGGSASDGLGLPVASADVNDDGTDDLILGARTASGPNGTRRTAGDVFVLFGGGGLGSELDLARDTADAVIYGADTAYLVPSSLALTDVNGDGTVDIILSTSTVGPLERLGAGAIYIVTGGDALKGAIDLADPAHRFAIVGAAPDDRLGAAIAIMPGEDGKERLLVLAGAADGPNNERPASGEVYLLDIPIESGR